MIVYSVAGWLGGSNGPFGAPGCCNLSRSLCILAIGINEHWISIVSVPPASIHLVLLGSTTLFHLFVIVSLHGFTAHDCFATFGPQFCFGICCLFMLSYFCLGFCEYLELFLRFTFILNNLFWILRTWHPLSIFFSIQAIVLHIFLCRTVNQLFILKYMSGCVSRRRTVLPRLHSLLVVAVYLREYHRILDVSILFIDQIIFTIGLFYNCTLLPLNDYLFLAGIFTYIDISIMI